MNDPMVVYPKSAASGMSSDGSDRNALQAMFQEEQKASAARRQQKEALERAKSKE